jgi:hypothetical protein
MLGPEEMRQRQTPAAESNHQHLARLVSAKTSDDPQVNMPNFGTPIISSNPAFFCVSLFIR